MTAASRVALFCAAVNIVGGLLFGYAIGFVGPYTAFTTYNTNCTALTSEESCSTVKHASCVWGQQPLVVPGGDNNNTKAPVLSNFTCLFKDFATNPCLQTTDKETCTNYDGCSWNDKQKMCNHKPAWTPSETGIFASAMTVGGMIGSLVAAKLIALLGMRRVMLLAGLVGLLASAAFTVGQIVNSFALLVVGRVLLGAAGGLACVACPTYVGEMAPTEYAGPLGVLFQVACTFGICLVAAIGLGLEPRDFGSDMQMQLRFQMLVLCQWICSLLFIPISCIVPPPKSELAAGTSVEAGEEQPLNNGSKVEPLPVDGDACPAQEDGALTTKDLIAPIIGSIALCFAQQFTGINAIMNYAPTITKSAGLAPLTGNFVIMLWNFVTTLVSIPLAKRVSGRMLFIVGATVASAACFLTGISVYPGVFANENVKHVLAGVGIIIFIAAFEIGMGSTFYVHAQSLFPGKYRGPGCSFIQVFQFILNIIINLCFPIALVGLSGGPSGDQDKGMGIIFLSFGTFGMMSVVALLKFLRPRSIQV